ncbi:MAG: four helix bundle protein [bacterium]
MDKKEKILERTKEFSLRIINLYATLPEKAEAQILGKQLLRSGTSVGAQLREGKRSRSNLEMISKIESSLQELEETVYWLELLADSEIVNPERLKDLINEADELIAILVTSVKTLKGD